MLTQQNRGKLDELRTLVERSQLRPHVGATYSLAEIPIANAHLKSRDKGLRGKIAIAVVPLSNPNASQAQSKTLSTEDVMIYEIAFLPVRSDRIDSFKRAFCGVSYLLSRAKGYQGHRLMQGVETPSHFSLIVRWQTLEDHTQGFEPSIDHQVFMMSLEECLATEPAVYHVRTEESSEEIDIFYR